MSTLVCHNRPKLFVSLICFFSEIMLTFVLDKGKGTKKLTEKNFKSCLPTVPRFDVECFSKFSCTGKLINWFVGENNCSHYKLTQRKLLKKHWNIFNTFRLQDFVSCVSSPAGFITEKKNPGQWNKCHGWTEHFFENSSNSGISFSDTLKFRKEKLKAICSPVWVFKIHWKLFCSFMISIICIFQD